MRKSEKKALALILIISVVVIFIIEFCVINFFYRKYYFCEKGKLIAKVGKINIYDNDIKERLNYLSKVKNEDVTLENIDKEILRAVLYEAYIDKMLEKEFYEKKFNKNEIDLSVNSYKRNLIRESYFKLYVLNDINDSDLKKKYEDLIKDVKDREERKISHIVVYTEEQAERILKSLKRNNNFEYLANKYSTDKISAINGGSLGYLMKGEIELEDFANIAFVLKKGEVSKPIKTKYGWHIIKVDDIRKTEIKEFDDVKDTIKNLLQEDLINNFMLKKINGVKIKLLN